jgi:hypothetical protein
MIREVNRKYVKQFGTAQKAIEEGYYIEWSSERIKNAFNGGKGTPNDLKRYMHDNKRICVFVDEFNNQEYEI